MVGRQLRSSFALCAHLLLSFLQADRRLPAALSQPALAVVFYAPLVHVGQHLVAVVYGDVRALQAAAGAGQLLFDTTTPHTTM